MMLGLVIPCYNEEAVLPETISRISSFLTSLVEKGKIAESSRAYFIDDGSQDRTWDLICGACATNKFIKGIKLSRNRGQQNALVAGLSLAEGDALISLDADLQDDLVALEKMVDAYYRGFQIVYGVRDSRPTDTLFKRSTARSFYTLMTNLGVKTIHDHADYRLLSGAAVDSLKQFEEVHVFLRGLVPLLGFKSTKVYYERKDRYAGVSKYPLRTMLALSVDAVTSFSTVPLRFITLLGISVALGTLLMSVWTVVVKLLTEQAVPGWASTVLPIYFLGGVQLFSLGVIGEYLGKVYLEVKHRPRYIVEEIR